MKAPLAVRLLIGVAEWATADPELAGDLLEESTVQPRWWLARQALGAAVRAGRKELLESAASAALFLLLPLALLVELRRYLLTLIPFRDNAEFRLETIAALATLAALLALARTLLAGRRGAIVAASAAGAALLWAPVNGAEWTAVVIATLAGGAAASGRPKQGESREP